MADDRNNQVVGYPTREIRVTGERCASMVHTTVAVSRLEIQLVNMSMSSKPQMRDGVRKASERFKSALDLFESAVRECQRDLDIASKPQRSTNRKPNPQVAKPTPGAGGDANAKQKQAQKGNQNQATPKPQKGATPQPGLQAKKPDQAHQQQETAPSPKAGSEQKATANPTSKQGDKPEAQKNQNKQQQPKKVIPDQVNQVKPESPVPVL